MGKKRVAVVDGEEKPKENKKSAKKEARVPGLKGGERVVVVGGEIAPEETETTKTAEVETPKEQPKKTKVAKKRGKRYLQARKQIDPQKIYSVNEAVKLLRTTPVGHFNVTAEAHFVVFKAPVRKEVSLPHFETKTQKVEIANEETLKKLETGKIDFDVLLSTPAFIPNLVKYAKVLGPKGLMPNPKNGTISDQPESAAKNFAKGSLVAKTEQNMPLIHTVFGKISQAEEELVENLQILLQTIGTRNIKKAVIKSTMGPAIKVAPSSIPTTP